MTDWELGQDLIYLSDVIAEKLSELDTDKYGDLYFRSQQYRAYLGDCLDKLGSHDFGIYDTREFKKEFYERLKNREPRSDTEQGVDI